MWKAFKIAKDLTEETIPINLTLGGATVVAGEAANSFAKFFHEKVAANVAKSKVVINDVYNGKCKLIVQNRYTIPHNIGMLKILFLAMAIAMAEV